MRNSVLAGLAIVAILDVVALVLVWAGGDRLSSHEGWIGLSILVLTGFPWSLLTELVEQKFLFLAILILCSLLNGGVVGFLIGKLVSMHRDKAPTIRLK